MPNFLILMFIFSKYNQIKNLAVLINKQESLVKPLLALFYTICNLTCFCRKLASVGKDIFFNSFGVALMARLEMCMAFSVSNSAMPLSCNFHLAEITIQFLSV